MSKILHEDAHKIIFRNKGIVHYCRGIFFLLNKEICQTPETILLLNC